MKFRFSIAVFTISFLFAIVDSVYAFAKQFTGQIISTADDQLVIRTDEATQIIFNLRLISPTQVARIIEQSRANSGMRVTFSASPASVITSQVELSGTFVTRYSYNRVIESNPSDLTAFGAPSREANALLRTQNRSFKVNTANLPPQTAAQISASILDPNPSGSAMGPLPITLGLPPDSVRALGTDVRPDCSETALSYDQILQIAERNSTPAPGRKPDMIQFLRSLPAATMQRFTFIYNSQSAQKDGVDRNWPRVIRSNRDGTLLMSYTCNPSSATYGTIEITRWNQQLRRYIYSEIDFRPNQIDQILGHWSPHRTENPDSCNTCHAPETRGAPDPRPNWYSYFAWVGAYGAIDDVLTPSRGFGTNDLAAYRTFRNLRRDNPCYGTLPWPDPNDPTFTPEERLNYPYQLSTHVDMRLRPNQFLSNTQARLNAQRLARKFEEDPRFRPVRFLMAMEAVGGCGMDLDSEIERHLPGYRRPLPITGGSMAYLATRAEARVYMDPRHSGSGATRLYAVGETLGFTARDWTLTPPLTPDSDNPTYVPGTPPGDPNRFFGDGPLSAFTQSALMEGLSTEAPELREHYRLSRQFGAAPNFGAQFSCVDNIGGEIILGGQITASITAERNALCHILTERHRAASGDPRMTVAPLQIAEPVSPQLSQLPLTPENIQRGRQIAQAHCTTCHASGSDESLRGNLLFLENNAAIRQWVTQRGINRLNARVFAQDPSDRMPRDRPALSLPDAQALDAYIRSTATQ